MRKTRSLIALLLLCLLAAGCSKEPERLSPATEPTGQVLVQSPTEPTQPLDFGMVYQPEAGMNPYQCLRLANRPVISLLYQGLFSVTSQFRAEPVLCQSFSCTEDLTSYTFTLADATFSDGSPVTAEDVAASLRASMGSAYYGDRLERVSEITTSGNTVTLQLRQPHENLPLLLDIPIVRQEDVAAALPVGSGAYVLRQSGTGAVLLRRADWWSEYPGAAQFDSIRLTACASPAEIRDLFEFGGIHLVTEDPGSPSYLQYRSDYELWEYGTGILLYLGCNRNSDIGSNGLVRAALVRAVDRESLTGFYRDFAQAAYLPASPQSDFYDSTLAASYSYDPTILQGILRDANLTGKEVTLLVCSDTTARVDAARAIADNLNACGLKVTVNALPGGEYDDALYYGNYDLHLGETRLSPNFDLSPFFQSGGSLSYGGMANSTCYDLCLSALENSGNYYDLHRAVMDDGGLCPLLFRTYAVYATRGALTGLMPGVDNVFHTANSRQLTDARLPNQPAE